MENLKTFDDIDLLFNIFVTHTNIFSSDIFFKKIKNLQNVRLPYFKYKISIISVNFIQSLHLFSKKSTQNIYMLYTYKL